MNPPSDLTPAGAPATARPALPILRILLLLVCFLVVTGFDACNDDPLLDPDGGSGCAGSHCSARVLPDSTSNPVVF